MRKKIVYIAHPIGGAVQENLESIRKIVREINLTMPDVTPFAPYWLDCHALDDNIPAERERGIENDVELLSRGFVDEIWLFGNRISAGMRAEILLCNKLGIACIAKTPETYKELNDMGFQGII